MTARGQKPHFGKISAQRRLATGFDADGGRLPVSRSRWRIDNVDVAAEVGQTVFRRRQDVTDSRWRASSVKPMISGISSRSARKAEVRL
jgi:hypothetical protein